MRNCCLLHMTSPRKEAEAETEAVAAEKIPIPSIEPIDHPRPSTLNTSQSRMIHSTAPDQNHHKMRCPLEGMKDLKTADNQ